MKLHLIILVIFFSVVSCSKKEKPEASQIEEVEFYENSPAEGFDVEGSHPQAIVIADRVMEAMGGRKAWDETKYISWVFFENRKLLWDKWNGNVRIDFLKDDLKIIVNINDLTGKVLKDGLEMDNPDSLNHYLTRGKNIWINDSYWLVMPFKLKDSGVTLSYLKEDTTQLGKPSYLLELTFKDVGVTPENYYEVWVDSETSLVSQWAFYRDHAEPEPNFINPWQNYKKYGEIMLSDDRGNNAISKIEVTDSITDQVFTEFNVEI